MDINNLKIGQKAIIKNIGNLGHLNERLVDLGIVNGEVLQLVRIAPFGNPLEIKIAQEHIIMRREDILKIELEDL